MGKRRTVGWRDTAASSLLVRQLPSLTLEGPALVAGDPRPEVPDTLEAAGLEVTRWSRRAGTGVTVSPWPPPGPYGAVALRLPPAREELEMTLHAVLSVLVPGGHILVYGAKDEGIGSASARLERWAETVRVVATGGRCRVLAGRRPSRLSGLRSTLAEWRETLSLPFEGLALPWISYPGVFAHGRLDEGTALLATALPRVTPDGRVLDFGCGSGILGGLMLARHPGCQVAFLDVDSVALQAVRENVPGARTLLWDGLPPLDEKPFHVIISNPPLHRGKGETLEMLEALVVGAPARLEPRGELVLVAQRRLPLQRMLEHAFAGAEIVRDDGRLYRVWRAWKGSARR